MKNYGQNGVGQDVQLGKNGLRTIATGDSVLSVRNKDNTDFAQVAIAPATADEHAVTLKQMKTRFDVRVVGQIDGGTPPAVVNGQVYICTTTGTTFTEGRLYYGVSGAWEEKEPADGCVIMVTTALTGGDLEMTAEHQYQWDLDTTSWIDLGLIPEVDFSNLLKTRRATYHAGDSDIYISPMLEVDRFVLNVNTAFVGDGELDIAGVDSDFYDLTKTGMYVCYGEFENVENLEIQLTSGTFSAGSVTVTQFYTVT